ncbi:MAG: hypothetical protein EXR72_05240 [Myxococcales bacterium]|nr:hypothetical protein [Myxococcales bacterium]
MNKALLGMFAAMVVAGCSGEMAAGPVGCKTDSLEPNDDRKGARRLERGATAGLTACAAEEDWYVVALAAGDTLKVNVDFKGPPESLRVTIHESTQGAAIAAAVPGGGGLETSLQPGAAGDYFVHVSAGMADLPYDLALDVAAAAMQCPAGSHAQSGGCVKDGCDDLGFEGNDDVAHAHALLPGIYKNLKICDSKDRDFYAITGPPGGGVITVGLHLEGSGDLDLFATDGTVTGGKFKVLGSASLPVDEDYLTYLPVAGGATVYLMVVGEKGATNDYWLDLTVDPLDPKRDCLTDCGKSIPMAGIDEPLDPMAMIDGYYVGTDPDYAYVRRDLGMWLRWAFGEMVKKWPEVQPVYLSDISQENGKTPGVDVGRPRHPTTTHVNGRDCDIAYYQTLPDNDYRIICGDGTDHNGNGQKGKFNDGYFCTTTKNVVNMAQQVWFLALLMSHPLFRVVGVDEKLVDALFAQAEKYVAAKELPAWVQTRFDYGLGYGNDGGWAFHHHHIHLSLGDR